MTRNLISFQFFKLLLIILQRIFFNLVSTTSWLFSQDELLEVELLGQRAWIFRNSWYLAPNCPQDKLNQFILSLAWYEMSHFSLSQIHMCIQGFPDGSSGKKSACTAGDVSSAPGWGRSPGRGNGNSLHYSCLGNPMDGSVWTTVHRIGKSQTRLSTWWIDRWIYRHIQLNHENLVGQPPNFNI